MCKQGRLANAIAPAALLFTGFTGLGGGCAPSEPDAQVRSVAAEVLENSAAASIADRGLPLDALTTFGARRIGVSLSGLLGAGLVLVDGQRSTLEPAADGSFVFDGIFRGGARYDVVVARQPVSPWQTCVVERGEGIVQDDDVMGIRVRCTRTTHLIGGVIHGARGALVLEDNASDELPIQGNGAFIFDEQVASGSRYEVTVARHPAGQRCAVEQPTGEVADRNIDSVVVRCVDEIDL